MPRAGMEDTGKAVCCGMHANRTILHHMLQDTEPSRWVRKKAGEMAQGESIVQL